MYGHITAAPGLHRTQGILSSNVRNVRGGRAQRSPARSRAAGLTAGSAHGRGATARGDDERPARALLESPDESSAAAAALRDEAADFTLRRIWTASDRSADGTARARSGCSSTPAESCRTVLRARPSTRTDQTISQIRSTLHPGGLTLEQAEVLPPRTLRVTCAASATSVVAHVGLIRDLQSRAWSVRLRHALRGVAS